MSLDLNKLENKLDEALSNETTETLTKFLNDKRMKNETKQTAMKLYTEADLKKVISIYSEEYKTSTDEILKELNLTPIELPSDEEIEKKAPYSTLGWGYEFGMNDGFKKGAKFVIDKIQGGEQ
jgi:hypothetical protein